MTRKKIKDSQQKYICILLVNRLLNYIKYNAIYSYYYNACHINCVEGHDERVVRGYVNLTSDLLSLFLFFSSLKNIKAIILTTNVLQIVIFNFDNPCNKLKSNIPLGKLK